MPEFRLRSGQLALVSAGSISAVGSIETETEVIDPPEDPLTEENLVRVSNVSGAAVASWPLEFGHHFARGEIANYPKILVEGVPVTTQANVKNRWSDGSVKFSRLAAMVALGADEAPLNITFENQLTANDTALTTAEMLDAAFDFEVEARYTANDTVTYPDSVSVFARAMLEAGHYRVEHAGPISQCIQLGDHSLERVYDFGFDAEGDRQARPLFDVTFYPALNKWHVRWVTEMSNMHDTGSLFAGCEIFMGHASPQSVYTTPVEWPTSPAPRPKFFFPIGTRLTKRFWHGTQPEKRVHIKPNMNHQKHVGVFPNYDTSFNVESSWIANNHAGFMLSRNHDLGSTLYEGTDPYNLFAGWFMRDMSFVGGREDLGHDEGRNVRWLLSGDWRMKEMCMITADHAAAWNACYREGRTGKRLLRSDPVGSSTGFGLPYSITDRKTFQAQEAHRSKTNNLSDGRRITGSGGTTGYFIDDMHTPEWFSIPYALTGDPYYRDMLQFWASLGASWGALNGTVASRGPTNDRGGINADGNRARAWTMRDRLKAHWYTPDDSPLKTYYADLLDDAFAMQDAKMYITNSRYASHPMYVWMKGKMDAILGVGNYSNPLSVMSKLWQPVGTDARQLGLLSPTEVGMKIGVYGMARDMGWGAVGLLEFYGKWTSGMFANPDPNINPFAFQNFDHWGGPPSAPASIFDFYQTWQEYYARMPASKKLWTAFDSADVHSMQLSVIHMLRIAHHACSQHVAEGPAVDAWFMTHLYNRCYKNHPDSTAGNSYWENNPKMAILPRTRMTEADVRRT